MQTLFNREHNRIANQLSILNPKWTDETIYQETRRIIIALLQHITFNEFIPLTSNDTSLKPLTNNSYYSGYNSSINPALYSEFNTAAFRMGHSLIRQGLSRLSVTQQPMRGGNFPFQSIVFQSDSAYNTGLQGLNSIFLGMINDFAWQFGTFGNQLQNNLFQINNPNGTTGIFY